MMSLHSYDPNVTNVLQNIKNLLLRRTAIRKLCGPRPSSANLTLETASDPQDLEILLHDLWAQNFKFYGAGVGIATLGGAGLVGNLLSFVTIVTMKKRNLFNNLLLTLTLFDIIFIMNGGLFFVQRAFNFYHEWYNRLFPKLIYPLAGIAMTGEFTILS